MILEPTPVKSKPLIEKYTTPLDYLQGGHLVLPQCDWDSTRSDLHLPQECLQIT
jgi:hypothetical protein